MESGVRVLVVGEESGLARLATAVWRESRAEVAFASNTTAALRVIRQNLPDLVVLDLTTCNGDAWSLLKALGSQRQALSTVVLGGGTDVKEAVEAMKLGAADYVPNAPESVDAVKRAMDILVAEATARTVREEPRSIAGVDEIVCNSDAMKSVMATVQRIAPFDANVLLLGARAARGKRSSRAPCIS